MSQRYTELVIEAGAEKQEELIALLSDFDPSGFEEKENELLVYFDGGFDLKKIESVISVYTYRVQTLEEKNWNEEWERNFSPVQVENFCAIRASFHQPLPGVQHEVVITPKMSFGTGHHATTYMMIQQMQTIDFTGKKVLDFGTGTGILAILAYKMGAAEILAIDTDAWSIENAIENAQNNHCNLIQIVKTSVLPQQIFDVVLANINRNVLLQYATELQSIVVHNGRLLLSGLLQEDEQVIIEKFSGPCKLIKKMERNNWISLLFLNK